MTLLPVFRNVFSSQRLVVPFFLISIIGAAVGLAALSVAFFPQLVGALAEVRLSSLGDRAVVEFGYCGFVFGDFLLFYLAMLFHVMAIFVVYAIIVPAAGVAEAYVAG